MAKSIKDVTISPRNIVKESTTKEETTPQKNLSGQNKKFPVKKKERSLFQKLKAHMIEESEKF